jgi:hypothetical protein
MRTLRIIRREVAEREKIVRSYTQEALDLAEMVLKKQIAYGNSFGRSKIIIQELYPDGIPTEKYQDALTVIRVIDKLFRIAHQKDAFGENPWRDIAGYALLSVVNQEEPEAEDGKC